MLTGQYTEIDEVIDYIYQHLDEPLPLSRLAGYAAYSPYHFTRIFKERIGLPPLYYVSSLRLQKAKDLLLHTNLSVRDIGLEIGQQSLGTFTTRFTERVGMTPSEFRNSMHFADRHFRSLRKLKAWRPSPPFSAPGSAARAVIQGTVQAEVPFEGVILIGLFAKPIPEGFPLYGTVLSSLGHFCFTDVKPGTYFLMATSVAWESNAMDILLPHTTLRTRSKQPIVVRPHSAVPYQQVTLYLPRPDDPPILISLPLLMNNFLNRVRENRNR
ncbi:helix-turn-helix transcriptional regulator [Paenibacillus filicis]|uniref:Helix-turn-helix transcriptional regulator n=1 Tax=Paenibacillus gyeongsangnamensis TaxID=3388067 RepID=A0ABT4Q4M8_9BACL|nr:helix-turn-helix transcriptional regulator [Paenibacillus filicis]MCZ8511784.1 helix-turn-helix transcriptional regulator [Paenibacillus filicis]